MPGECRRGGPPITVKRDTTRIAAKKVAGEDVEVFGVESKDASSSELNDALKGARGNNTPRAVVRRAMRRVDLVLDFYKDLLVKSPQTQRVTSVILSADAQNSGELRHSSNCFTKSAPDLCICEHVSGKQQMDTPTDLPKEKAVM